MKQKEASPLMYVDRMDAFVNRWFTTYPEARASLESEGGYLLPYKNHFFVTVGDAVWELGLGPDDPDWERIGWDRVQPLDAKARRRLKEKREMAL